jgi:hypothetical protein
MPKIQFDTNCPVALRLSSLEEEVVESKFGGNQIKFTAHEGLFWVSEAVGSILADQIRKKKIQPNVQVEICRREIAQGNGRKGILWQIDPLGFIPGEQPDGTFAIPAPKTNGANGSKPPAPPVAAAPEEQPQGKNTNGQSNGSANGNGIGNANGNGHAATVALAHAGWALHLREQACALVDVYSDVLSYSGKYGAAVKPDDVRSILLSVFINISKSGGAR